MLVGTDGEHGTGAFERLLLSMKTTARKELVILHPQRYVQPGSTREWLQVSRFCLILAAAEAKT